MLDHSDLLDIGIEKFTAFVDKLDDAVGAGSASLYYAPRSSGTTLNLFKREDTRFEEDEWADAVETAANLNQLLVFAFEGAPDSVVAEWGSAHNPENGASALELVRVMSDRMPNTREEWYGRRQRHARALGDFTANVVIDVTDGDLYATLRADSFFTTGLNLAPVGSSRQYFEAKASRAELQRVIHSLEAAVARMVEIESDDDDDDDVKTTHDAKEQA